MTLPTFIGLDLAPGESLDSYDVLSPLELCRGHYQSEIARHFYLETIHLVRKTCLSCGAIQDPYGNLPCGH